MWSYKYCTHVWYIIAFTCKWNNLAVSGSVLRNNSMIIDIVSINDVHTHNIYIYTGHVANGQHLKSILKP